MLRGSTSRRFHDSLSHPIATVVCGSVADCDDFDLISDWGEAHLDFLRTLLPFRKGVPCGRWLNILMNRIDPVLFAECFTTGVRETWPGQADFVAIDGKTSRRSHDRAKGLASILNMNIP